MNAELQIEKALSSLKDFQLATVNVAVEKLLNGQSRFLIADEVGLGKTIVAKGIIASLVKEKLKQKKMLNVIYICSNLALAKQNLSKLSFVESSGNDDADFEKVINTDQTNDRITDLAYEEESSKNKYGLHIKALTPATSFDIRSIGKADERVLLYRVLSHYEEFSTRHVALKWFLKGKKSARHWNDEIEFIKKNKDKSSFKYPTIRKKVFTDFLKELKRPLDLVKFKITYSKLGLNKETSFWKILLELFEENKQNRSFEKANTAQIIFGKEHNKLKTELRFRLSIVCKEFLQADLFVLDEFQRFSNLIQSTTENDDAGTFIAKSVFSKIDAKVIMLSATPFKAYTTKFEETQGENHYQEFKSVLLFLINNFSSVQWEELDTLMKNFFIQFRELDASTEGIEKLKITKSKIETIYQTCMARTERNIVQKFSAKNLDDSIYPIKITKDDIIDFVSTDEIIKTINTISDKKLPIPIEYVKSSPFPFSFLQDYEHMKVFESEFEKNIEVQKVAKKAKRAWLPVERIQDFKALLPESEAKKDMEPNAKLRKLYDETVRNKGWQLLWIPTSIKYYNVTKGAYVNTETFSKTLIFSAWKMVPRMISALVSYEAERLSIGKYLEKNKDQLAVYHNDDKRRFPRPLLNYRFTGDGNLSGMSNLMLFYPSFYLGNLYDPEQNIHEKKTLGEIKKMVAKTIKDRLIKIGVFDIGNKYGDSQKWDWYAILLLDKTAEPSSNLNWINSFLTNKDDVESEDERLESTSGGKYKHYQEIQKCLSDTEYTPNLSKISAKQLHSLSEHLADFAIAAPGTSCFRSMKKFYKTDERDLLESAFVAAQGFNSLFNKAESIAIINEFAQSKSFHLSVLNYCVLGNIQAMLDEYIYQLRDAGNIAKVKDCAEMIRDVLAVNAGSVETKYISAANEPTIESFPIRTHYAIPFGMNSSSDLKVGNRQIRVREAFNSPFRPFVLTSTSIGQEGLDFHFYCSNLIHWNLPSNPIDMEQREGRIKRFKGLSIRRAIADKYINKIVSNDNNIWDTLYKIAEQNKQSNQCDLVPFWIMPDQDKFKLKTLIPMYLYSKDFEKLRNIKTVLKNYRLTFGQPRQEELLEILSEKLNEEELELFNRKLFINLSPFENLKNRK